ncbi:hypothetical protein [Desulfovibrio falkowii]
MPIMLTLAYVAETARVHYGPMVTGPSPAPDMPTAQQIRQYVKAIR